MMTLRDDNPLKKPARTHFLPMATNLFDRVFISIMLFVAINLLWMRFLEAFLPLWLAAAVSFIVAFFVITRG